MHINVQDVGDVPAGRGVRIDCAQLHGATGGRHELCRASQLIQDLQFTGWWLPDADRKGHFARILQRARPRFAAMAAVASPPGIA